MWAETKSTELDHTINYVVMLHEKHGNHRGGSYHKAVKSSSTIFSSSFCHPYIQNKLTNTEHSSITMTSNTAAGPSASILSRQIRIMPPDMARCLDEGQQYSEFGDLWWRLHGQPDGTAPRDAINPDLTREEAADAFMGTIGFRTRLC
jgi:hypothetical protein